MSLTIELLKFIGSPYLSLSHRSSNVSNAFELLTYSTKNRLSLLFLNAAKSTKFFNALGRIYDQQITRYKETFEAVSRISQALSNADVEHAVFKTLRPYVSTTVDIDVLIFGNVFNYEKSLKTAIEAGYKKLARGPMSTTFLDPKVKIGVDLYNEVAVSYVPYIDKVKLATQVIDTKLPSGEYIRTLACEADLVSIIAHSIIKENIYTLSEYYTYIYYLEQLSVDHFIKLAEEAHLKSATMIHTAITALLYKVAYRSLHYKLQQIMAKLGVEQFETSRVIKNDLEMPHKYHPATMARCLLEMARENKTKKGIADQIIHGLNPSFSRDFFNKLSEHMTRRTY